MRVSDPDHGFECRAGGSVICVWQWKQPLARYNYWISTTTVSNGNAMSIAVPEGKEETYNNDKYQNYVLCEYSSSKESSLARRTGRSINVSDFITPERLTYYRSHDRRAI
jgi:hypothetical protein